MLDVEAHFEYELMNEAYQFLPALLRQEFGFEVHEKFARKFVKNNQDEPIQVNIIGEATRNGNDFVIVGESKPHLAKSHVEEFLNRKLKRLEGVFQGELFPIIVTHIISQPDVEEFARQQGIKRVYYSYEFA